MQEHEHVVNILEEAKQAAERGDIIRLKQLSDQTIHSTAIYQDSDNILVAIIVYSLSKLLERRQNYSPKDFEKYFKYYLDTIDYSRNCINQNNCPLFRDRIKEMLSYRGLSSDLKKSVGEVFEKAKINKASKIYEHGISMGATAKLLGISLWDLTSYVGQGTINDMKEGETLNIRARVKKALDFFE